MPLLFATTLFLSATLLFVVQPMIAKMLLPFLGGAPSVWNTSMVFFQAMLLAGYAYAHLITARLSRRRQAALHLGLLLLAALSLPITVTESAAAAVPTEATPVFWLLGLLFAKAGLPFFVVAATAPLLQKWFSATNHPAAKDPYFLYAASNLGSLAALLAYPAVLEPRLRLFEQSRFWTAAYVLLVVLIGTCVALSRRNGLHPSINVPPGESHSIASLAALQDQTGSGAAALVLIRQRFLWIAVAFVPSSLMLGVTTYLTTDIASIPLFWVIPLALYLFTFVLAFARRKRFPSLWLDRALPIAAVGLTYLLLSEATQPIWLPIILHLLFFFLAAMVCHGRLAATRPPTADLTGFYLCISIGGVLGGVFNALVAPAVFNSVAEYPIGIVLACLLRTDSWRPALRNPGVAQAFQPAGDARFPARSHAGRLESRSNSHAGKRALRLLDFTIPLAIGLVTFTAVQWVPAISELAPTLRLVAIFGMPALLTYLAVDRPIRFALSLAALVLAGSFYAGGHGRTLLAERNFFGVSRVTLDPGGLFHRMIHGNTVHGRQFIDPARHCEPLSYYHRSGPLGQIFDAFSSRPGRTNIAVVGLGAGSMVCYSKPDQRWTYYEINPAVIQIAQNTNYFSFLSNCASAPVRMVLGDARLQLRHAPEHAYDLIVLDAFSSDAIPVHLLTAEALDLYLSKLADNGMLAFHISNRCLNLEPVLGKLAAHAELICIAQDENDPSPQEEAEGKDASHWVVMARQREDLGRLVKLGNWSPVPPLARVRVWTDDFSNLLGAFKWD